MPKLAERREEVDANRNYTIQVRSFADATRFSDWNDPITRICT